MLLVFPFICFSALGTPALSNPKTYQADLFAPYQRRKAKKASGERPFDKLQDRLDLSVTSNRTTNITAYQFIPARHNPTQKDFVEQRGTLSTISPALSQPDSSRIQEATYTDFTIDDMFHLCQRFLPTAMQHCASSSSEGRIRKLCQEYLIDCTPFLVPEAAGQRPESVLEAIANAYSSGVGLTYYHWGVNGIPFYPINEEGSISNGATGKIDYGSWGGGYSNNFGVRDFWTMNSEAGGNWYEGLYGYRTGWHVPIVQSLGVEGAGGSQIHVPVKEKDFGKPLHATSGYMVGPYAGIAQSTGVDWLNGRVTTQSGFASPYVGVNVNSGSSIGFPSVASVMQQLAKNWKHLQFSTTSQQSLTSNIFSR